MSSDEFSELLFEIKHANERVDYLVKVVNSLNNRQTRLTSEMASMRESMKNMQTDIAYLTKSPEQRLADEMEKEMKS